MSTHTHTNELLFFWNLSSVSSVSMCLNLIYDCNLQRINRLFSHYWIRKVFTFSISTFSHFTIGMMVLFYTNIMFVRVPTSFMCVVFSFLFFFSSGSVVLSNCNVWPSFWCFDCIMDMHVICNIQ